MYRDGVSEGTTASDGSGAWSFTPGTSWADGTYSLTATATDAANNTSGSSNTVVLTIDTNPPPQDTDSDDDGVTDDQEILDGTDPNSPDSDSDGLTDSEEKEQDTNPNDSDSDDDSVTDGEEIQAGTNPRDRGSVNALRDTTLCTQYARTATLGIQTIYGIQASEAIGTVMRGTYNTFLKQGCRLLMVNPTSSEVGTTVSMKRYDGTNVEAGRAFTIPAHGLTNFDLCSEDEENVYGVVTVQPATPNTVSATVLRIGENEDYRFPTPVRE